MSNSSRPNYSHTLSPEQAAMWEQFPILRCAVRQLATHQARKVGATQVFLYAPLEEQKPFQPEPPPLDAWELTGNYEHQIW